MSLMLPLTELVELQGHAYMRRDVVGLLESALHIMKSVDLLQNDGYTRDMVTVVSCCTTGALGLAAKANVLAGINKGREVVHGDSWRPNRYVQRVRGDRMNDGLRLEGKGLQRYVSAIRLLREVTGWEDLQAWNDAEGRTRDEVIDAFADALALARVRKL